MIRWTQSVAALMMALPLPAAAADRGIDTARCKSAISGINEVTGASFDRASPSGDNAFLKHRAAREFSLSCAPYTPLTVFASVGQALPSADYFALIAKAGTVVTKLPRKELETEIRRCQLTALKSSDEQAEIHRPHVQIDCQAFERDGGATSILVSPE